MSAQFSCYGEPLIETPHVDRLAAEGVQFNKAFVTAPVCSTCRSAFITGMYQTSIGAHHHRSGRGTEKIRLPDGVQLVPAMFQNAGYYTTVSSWPPRGANGKNTKLGKTDYNFQWNQKIYDGNDWSGRKDGQPFFAQIQLPGGKLRGGKAAQQKKFLERVKEKFGDVTDPQKVVLPPYYPRDPVLLADWAAYLDSVRMTDAVVGEIVARLKKEGVYDNTLLLFMTDHGISHARGKQFLYEEGIHVPLVIRGPSLKAGTKRDDLVEHIDIAALSLGAAGIERPQTMQARDILAADYQATGVHRFRSRPLRRNRRAPAMREIEAVQVHPQLPAKPTASAAVCLQRRQRHLGRTAQGKHRRKTERRAAAVVCTDSAEGRTLRPRCRSE